MKKQSYECHMKQHRGERPEYMCDQCSQSYFNVFALKRHYLKHTGERAFTCQVIRLFIYFLILKKFYLVSFLNLFIAFK